MPRKSKSQQANPDSKEESTAPNPFLDMWNKFAGAMEDNPFLKQDMSGLYPNWLNNYQDMGKQFYNMPMGGVYADIFPKFVAAADVYMKLFKAWTENAGKISSSPETMQRLLNLWLNSQQEVFGKLFGLPVPSAENMGDFNEGFKKSLENFTAFYEKNYKPFAEHWTGLAGQMQDTLQGKPDPAKYRAVYDTWIKGYESAFGKFIKMPMVGPSRQTLEKIHRSVDSFMKYCAATVDFNMVLYSPSKDTIEDLAQKARDILKGEATQEKYKQFYELLVKTFEDRFYQLFKTPAFSQSIKSTLDAYLDFRNDHFAVIEEMLKSTPIITRTEINDVYQELYNLKKRIKDLEQLLKNQGKKK